MGNYDQALVYATRCYEKKDIPQVVISFNGQSQDVFSFHIIVLRHVHDNSSSIRESLEKVCPSYRWIEIAL